MAKTIIVKANRSFSTIKQGDVFSIDESDARAQAFLASGYLTEVSGEDAKGAKKVTALEEDEPEIVWDGTPGNRRGTTVQENEGTEDPDMPKPSKVASTKNGATAKESDGTR